ncbi:MAG: putative acetyltransferase [Arenicella sp.]|jgi:putative acetyltransferase
MEITYRLIKESDNAGLSKVIKETLEALDLALDGTVYTDKATDFMFNAYQELGSIYLIAEQDGQILGGSGIAPIPNQVKNYCELQRMFLNEEARGKGIGQALMLMCLEFAKKYGYELVYLETFASMDAARKLYERSGFEYIPESLGDTGHFSCDSFMTLTL